METTNRNIEAQVGGANYLSIDEAEILNPLETEIERLREELSAERDARLRLAADFDNYRRRTKSENARATEAGKQAILERLISLADDLDLAAESAGESTDAVAEGLRLIRRRFAAVLAENNVRAFESTGEKFDPERHEAFDVASGTAAAFGTIHAEIRRGYFWNDKLLRPALVVVAE